MTKSPESDAPTSTTDVADASKSPVPEGTFAIGAGLIVAAITAYGFQILADRNLSEAGYKSLNNLWFLVFIVAPGFFQPLEQEIARAIAHRRAVGVGGAPVVRKAARLGAVLGLAVSIIAIIAGPLWLVDDYFDGEVALLGCLLIAVATYYVAHMTRGTLSGNKRFGAYGLMHGSEGTLRILFVIAVVAVGLDTPGWFALALVAPPAFAVLISLRGQKDLLLPGPDAPYSELSSALTLLLVSTALAQVMSYAPALAVTNMLSDTSNDHRVAAGFVTGMFIARIPILLFQAVQAALLPKLSTYAAAGKHDDFRLGLKKLLFVVIGVAVLGVIGGATVGPTAGRMLFSKWTLGNRDLAMLAGGAGGFILALTLAQGLIALRGYKHVAISWVVGILVFLALMPIGDDVVLRAEVAFVVSCWVTASLVGTLLLMRMRVASATIGELVEIIAHEHLEI